MIVFQHGWSDEAGGTLYPWAQVIDGAITAVSGRVLELVDSVVNPSDGSRHAVIDRRLSYVEDTGVCWWTARAPTTGPNDPIAFGTRRLEIDSDPSDAVALEFAAIETTCVSPFSEETLARFPDLRGECDRAVLFATSDLDSDMRMEYWYRLPDRNGMAWAIAEVTEAGTLQLLVKECSYFVCANPAF